MSRFLIVLFFILSITTTLLKVNCQTYSNCKNVGNGYKVEWTVDQTGNKLTARFTVPNSSGYAAIGLKTGSTSGMTGATILVTSQTSIIGEYYASANTQPSAISGAPYYTSANSSISGSTTTISMVRSLTRPGTAPSTYYEIANGNSMKLLFAAHSSSSYPSYHQTTSSIVLDLFTTSTCGQAQTSTKTSSSTKTGSSTKTNNGVTVFGREVILVISMVVAVLFVTLF